MSGAPPPFLWELFQALRAQRMPLGPDDLEALRTAMHVGFGWRSREALRELCCALWAKSRQEQALVARLYERYAPLDLEMLDRGPEAGGKGESGMPVEMEPTPPARLEAPTAPPVTHQNRPLPPLPFSPPPMTTRPFLLEPRHPLSWREMVQAWRRLRRTLREGPPVEVDLEATLAHRSRTGLPAAPVWIPARRNVARLVLLVDRQGSMAPFHGFVDELCGAVLEAGRLRQVRRYYFHDVPEGRVDPGLIDALSRTLFPPLDPVLPRLQAMEGGELFVDRMLVEIRSLEAVLRTEVVGAGVVVISDAGAARGRYDVRRLLATAAFLKALRARASAVAWLNPLPRRYWEKSTAGQVARHVPMFPIDREGLYRVVNVLRGQSWPVERPI